MLIESTKRTTNSKLGIIIDLTNTDRFYDVEGEVKRQNIKHIKINCRGHGETPSLETTKLFINVVDRFIQTNPTDLVGVHCTHGFNRTGFMICSYLVEKLDFSIDMAVVLFAESRPPGIYKQDYINELFKRYAYTTDEPVPITPGVPDWENEGDDENEAEGEDDETANLSSDDSSGRNNKPQEGTSNGFDHKHNPKKVKRHRNEISKLNPVFAEPNLPGIEPCLDPDEVVRVQSLAQSICGWRGFDTL